MPAFAFDPNDLHQLNRLAFSAGGTTLEQGPGRHKSRKIGDGTDFLDFRQYTPGDDFRRVDWQLYGRLRQLFVRLHDAPRHLAVTLLVDVSQSMLFGTPLTKLAQAQRLACALGFVGLRSGDRVYVDAFAGGLRGGLGPVNGARSIGSIVKFLQDAPTGGESDLLAAVAGLRARRRVRGLLVVLSDFLNVPRCEEALHVILASGARVLAVQVLDPIDRGAGLSGTVRLQDSEKGNLVDVRIDSSTLAAYQRAFEDQRQQLENFCARHRQHYILASTGEHYIQVVAQAMRSKAVVR